MTIVTSTISADTFELINDVADAVKRKYGATKALAVKLFDELPSDWYNVEHSDTSENAKHTLAVAQLFRDTLRNAGHKNPSVEWTRVRDAGRIHAEGEQESEGAGAKKRTLKLRLIEELTKLHKAGIVEKFVNADEAEALTYIASALASLKVDLNMLK
jgi:phenylpyruvate tautomerase PptA (4-oxalocrotonate tautomerase family)